MKEIDTGKEKVKKICDILRKETLEPARQEADEMMAQAKLQAAEIVRSAKEEAEKLKAEASKEVERQRVVFTTSLQQAGKQMLEALKNEIESKLLNPALSQVLNHPLAEKKVVFDLIEAIVFALKKEGVDADLDIAIPPKVSPQEINELLMQHVGESLRSYTVSLGGMQGGVAVRLNKENVTIDITDQALKEWIYKYVRQDFRKILFEVR